MFCKCDREEIQLFPQGRRALSRWHRAGEGLPVCAARLLSYNREPVFALAQEEKAFSFPAP